jgi:hypothetical protein
MSDPETGDAGEFDIDRAMAGYRLHEVVESAIVEDYDRRALDNPSLATFATEEADRDMKSWADDDPDLYAVLTPYEGIVRSGFYRIHFELAREDETGEYETVSDKTIAETFIDIGKIVSWDGASLAHEWATLTTAMRSWEGIEPDSRSKSPYEDPDRRFSYLYGLVKALGSTTAMLEVNPPKDPEPEPIKLKEALIDEVEWRYRGNGLETIRITDQPGTVYEPHRHEGVRLFTLGGSAMIKLEDNPWQSVEAGEELYIQDDELHEVRVGEQGWEYIFGASAEEMERQGL